VVPFDDEARILLLEMNILQPRFQSTRASSSNCVILSANCLIVYRATICLGFLVNLDVNGSLSSNCPSIFFTLNALMCVCFFVLCNRHWFNKAPGPDPRGTELGVAYLPSALVFEVCLREDLFIERTTPQAPTKPNTRKPAFSSMY
jgi:hypothetical protein